jgi:succinate-acetate transporter protein
MSLRAENREKIDRLLERDPNVTIFLRPIAAPAALGLAGFAGSTWITATWVARWWGDESSPTIFFPFVAFWGGLGQFIAGLFGYAARDTLITVIHVLWGSFLDECGVVVFACCKLSPRSVRWKGYVMLTSSWQRQPARFRRIPYMSISRSSRLG